MPHKIQICIINHNISISSQAAIIIHFIAGKKQGRCYPPALILIQFKGYCALDSCIHLANTFENPLSHLKHLFDNEHLKGIFQEVWYCIASWFSLCLLILRHRSPVLAFLFAPFWSRECSLLLFLCHPTSSTLVYANKPEIMLALFMRKRDKIIIILSTLSVN